MEQTQDQQHEKESLFLLAQQYRHGNGVKKNLAKARECYEKACKMGNAKAMVSVGSFYANGECGYKKNVPKAMEFYQLAGQHGEPIGYHNIGLFHFYGDGVKLDKAKGVEYFKRSYDEGCSQAGYNLAMCYHNGEGVPKDERLAMEVLRASADGGYVDSQYSIANICLDEEKYDEAAKYFKLAAEQEYPEAMCNLAICYEQAWGVEKNEEIAYRLYQDSAAMGLPNSVAGLMKMAHRQGRKLNLDTLEIE